jgi:hypothetical protein
LSVTETPGNVDSETSVRVVPIEVRIGNRENPLARANRTELMVKARDVYGATLFEPVVRRSL